MVEALTSRLQGLVAAQRAQQDQQQSCSDIGDGDVATVTVEETGLKNNNSETVQTNYL